MKDLALDRDGVAFEDGPASGERTPSTVKTDTWTNLQSEQIDASYEAAVRQRAEDTGIPLSEFQEGRPAVMPVFTRGFIVAYGIDSTKASMLQEENEHLSTDGQSDSDELQFCVFLDKAQGDVSSSQFIR